jgi:isopenicillin-N N-acyltransferase-like protein
MKILDIDGSAYERGLAQGAAVREMWGAMEREFFSQDFVKDVKPKFLPDDVVRFALGAIGRLRERPAVKRYMPAQFNRIEGIAKGLGITRHYLWGIHYLELMFCLSTDSLEVPELGCTQVHATPAATADGRPLTGRNYDFPNMLLPYQIIRRERPSEPDRFATVTVTQAPLAGTHHGFNERGLLVCVNNNRSWKEVNKRGVPYMLLVQEALETCANVGEATAFLTSFPARANAGYFGLMDESGECCVIEFTAKRTAVRKPDEAGVLAVTNHYIVMEDANLPEETVWKVKGMEGVPYIKSPRMRYEAANRRLHEAAGKITIDTMKSILRDHSGNAEGKGDDFTVCCHGAAGSTLASFIIDLRERTMWVADGNPCSSEYAKVELRRK